MKRILVLGAGASAPYLIHHLLEVSKKHDWFVTVGDRDLAVVETRVNGHARGSALEFDVNDVDLLASQIERSDLVVNLQHDFLIRYLAQNSRRERIVATLVAYGEPGGFTAMAKTVGMPAAIAAELILTDQIPLTGCHIPTHPAIYKPILAELEKEGLRMTEMVESKD